MVASKMDSSRFVEEKAIALTQQQSMVSQSQPDVVHWETKVAAKYLLASLDKDILS